MPEAEARHLQRLECPTYDDTPPLGGKPLAERRVAIISTAGLHKRGDRPFRPGDGSYRVIPAETPANELVMSHISVNFDRTGFQQDLNVVFPIDRLRELVADGEVGSMASVHYSFMPRRARLVGRVLQRLPPATKIPWHRVVNAKGEVSYSLSRNGGDIIQRRLLEKEGIKFDDSNRLDLERCRWRD